MNISNGKIIKAQKIVIYGPEGIGKTTFASQFPNPLFIDTEGSTKHIDVRRFDDRPTSWTMLKEQIKYAYDNPDICQTLVIDTTDWAEQLCIDNLISTHNVDGIEGFGYGKGYVYLQENFGKLLNALSDIVENGINVVLTAHAMMRKFEQPDEMGAYDRWELKLSKKVAPMVKEWADMVLFANYKTYIVKDGNGKNAKSKAQGGSRVMYTTHHPCWDAKNRHGLPEELPFDYKQIAHCIISSVNPTAQSVVAETASTTITANCTPVTENVTKNAAGNVPVPVDVSDAETKLKISTNIPKPLRDLMIMNKVEDWEIKLLVSQKGYYPESVEIADYDEDFINGALIGGWDKMLELISANRDYPF